MDNETIQKYLKAATSGTGVETICISQSEFHKLNFRSVSLPTIFCVFFSSHWYLLYFYKSDDGEHNLTVFDSYGTNVLEFYNLVVPSTVKRIEINREVLQSDRSNRCGYFCIYFAFFLSRGVSLRNILHQLPSQIYEKEKTVATFTHKLRQFITSIS